MKCLDRYISTEFIKKFALFFIILNAFLFFADTYTYLEKFLQYHVSLENMFYHYVAQSIIYLPLILPLTFVMTSIFVFVVMHRDHEIISLLSSGISFFSITRMLWLFGLIGSFVLLWSNFYWIPNAHKYLNHYWECFEKNDANGNILHVKHLTLNTKNRLYYINRYDKIKGIAFGIAIHEYDSQEKEWRRIVAQSGLFNDETHAWTLNQGREVLFHPQIQVAEEIHLFEQRVFPEFNDPPKLMLLLQLPLQNLSLPQLQKVIEVQKEIGGDGPYKMCLGNLILGSCLCFLGCWIALPILFSTFGKNPWPGILKLGTVLLIYIVLSHILYALGANGTIHWLYASLIPFCFLSLIPLPWIRKLY
ncbi:MAG: LptF/LptG family permease [Puniceicoccales bacterium]|jgi:lipopolysaccharide export LptBFGC system permease protein LptF|nr:LptF/LptG family permease [Puniceicoccales bacterium]